MEQVSNKMKGMEVAEATDAGSKKFTRRDHLQEIEEKVIQQWSEAKVFEADPEPGKPKYMVTFPFPYMNGYMHVGHLFTLTKAEFASRYHRLKGENVVFPFAFHCTGMPIQAAANKLKAELETYGCPPDFSIDEADAPAETQEKTSTDPANKAKGKKSKAVAKAGAVRQYDIMKISNIPEEEIPAFSDPLYWLEYFPPHGQADLERFGISVDWRRSFMTTDINPYFDAFVQWQMRKLKERGRIFRGKRPTVYSTIDQQSCQDHDRAAGEGANPQEYTLVKLKVQKLQGKLSALEGKNVYLAPATLRPETMYGQTNCFVLPDGDYGAFVINDAEDVFIISRRAARNLAYQDMSRVWGQEECLLELKGWDLLGLPLSAPNAPFDTIYTLPLLTISMSKGTGVVTSVPSDSPDDFAAVRDLKQKPALREKFHIEEHMIVPYDIVPIIHIPEFGDKAAEFLCDELKIKSQNDKDKLAKAKERVYLKGFYEGVMLVGSQKGRKVCDAKQDARQELLDNNQGIVYWEPESLVMSRSGDECVVAHLDQWYSSYGEEDWKTRVVNHVSNPETFNAYDNVALGEYKATLGWMKEWAVCRQVGLGTKLPWDTEVVVESLSDSTIYMAYYTIAHLLQEDLKGDKKGTLDVSVDQLTDQVFDFIFLKGEAPKDSSIPMEKLEQMRQEFEYWYPMDLRVSGKDLIRNHLTMNLYTHAEIWRDDPEKWPRGFFTNGHVQVDGAKMSKSKGNFLTLKDCARDFGADATRFACADAGDGMDDANFALDTCNMAILRLTTEEEWIKKMMSEYDSMRSGELTFNDQVFLQRINVLLMETQKAFDEMHWREGLRTGFFEFQIARDNYRELCTQSGTGFHKDVIQRFIETQLVVLSPITPHFCEHCWTLIGKEGFVSKASWPQVENLDLAVLRAGEYLSSTIKNFRDTKLKGNKGKKGKAKTPEEKPKRAHVFLTTEFPEWKKKVLIFLAGVFDKTTKSFTDDFMKQVKAFVAQDDELKKQTKDVMQFAAYVKSEATQRGEEALELKMPYDEKHVLSSNKPYLCQSLELEDVEFYYVNEELPSDADAKKVESAAPGKPTISFLSA